ncbi:MAG: hypothetical protein WC209_04335 [Ignavibacteriaceae bacterium]
MKWHFINSGLQTGKFNMDFDLQLATNCKEDEAYLRLYRWKPHCISLGANQSFESIDLEKAKKDLIDVVQRPTGGRAILHAKEITYSVVIPLSSTHTPSEIYREINFALLQGLFLYDELLSEAELETQQPDFSSIYKDGKGTACFATSARSEIKYEGKKLIGSAQRKLGNIILQHGSILCGKQHRKLYEYLHGSEQEKFEVKDELEKKTIELETILNKPTDYDFLGESLKSGFENHFKISFLND